jgi:hypothetical protein
MKETRDQVHMWKPQVIKILNYAIPWSCEVCILVAKINIWGRWLWICEVSGIYN